ncbi:MAG: MBL fold metallo-hydrolase [Candidatus Aenigmarchaeota archaeon]|nr:MBL fold metallo-hydrolase [Candidatus Aenigmarchaeota archaeon]
MKITFLGTGGGRFVMIDQLRATGGFIVESKNLNMHVDPGPGALIKAKQFHKNLKRLNSIFVSHPHTDHYTDMEVVIEAMTKGAKIKKGFLITSKSVINMDVNKSRTVSKYHLDTLEKYYSLDPDEEIRFLNTTLKTTKCFHREEKCIGFVLEDEKKLGYTADGEYYEEQANYFKDCDCLIINCLRPRYAKPYGHMTADKAKILISQTKPKLAILQHFGMKMLFGVAEKEAKWIEQETGVKTIAARDGQVFELKEETKSLENFS